MSSGDAYKALLETVPTNVLLLAVSKHHSAEEIRDVYDFGCRDFGENKVQELVAKYDQLPKDVNWHFIGHLQTNKVKYIAPFVFLIHGVDSLKLLNAIDKEAKKNARVIDVLLQVKIADEDSKFGLTLEEMRSIVVQDAFGFSNVRLVGLMGMATNIDNVDQIRAEFRALKELFDSVKLLVRNQECFSVLSMGMSGDYLIAIEEGSTLVRMGTSVFGQRKY